MSELLKMMSAQASLPKSSVDRVIERIFALRQISRADQRLLMSAMLSQNSIAETDRSEINRVFDALQNGKLKVVD